MGVGEEPFGWTAGTEAWRMGGKEPGKWCLSSRCAKALGLKRAGCVGGAERRAHGQSAGMRAGRQAYQPLPCPWHPDWVLWDSSRHVKVGSVSVAGAELCQRGPSYSLYCPLTHPCLFLSPPLCSKGVPARPFPPESAPLPRLVFLHDFIGMFNTVI